MNRPTDGPGSGIEQMTAQPGSAHSAGTRLRLAREAAQLTIDDVAQQLKLARRQVIALENDDVDALPGPTFVRGFIRNYARFLKIDAAPLIEANRLASASATPAAAIETIAPTMSELPTNVPRDGTGVARWLIPTGLVLLLAAGVGYYQFSDSSMAGKKSARKDVEPGATTGGGGLDPKTSSAAEAPVGTGAPPAPDGKASASEPPPASASAVPTPNLTGAPAAPTSPTRAPTNAPNALQSAPDAGAQTSSNSAAEGRLELELGGSSWIEVRDKHGDVLISRTMPAKSRQLVRGELPMTLRIGNASNVRVTLDGRPVDLSPFTRNEIAKLVLPAAGP